MYNRHIKIILLVFIICFAASYALRIQYSELSTSCMITSLSVIIGFITSAISTLYGRKFLKKLYSKRDLHKPGQSQLDTLSNYFKISINICLFSIVWLVLLVIIKESGEINELLQIDHYNLICRIGQAMILPLLLANFCVLYWLVKVMIKGFIDEAKETV
jgi:hypothetical protein